MARLQSVDTLRGATMALMVLVNNPGKWSHVYAPLEHSPWNGFTLADFVFPCFLFIMGVSIYLSLSKGGFRLTGKMLRRTLMLLGIGLLLGYVSGIVWGGHWGLDTLRIPGVLQRFALCYGIAVLLVCLLPRTLIPWIAGGLLLAYAVLLLLGNGYVYGPENILSRVDLAVFGRAHILDDNGIDPEGLLSTVPAVAHTLIGFCFGGLLARGEGRKMLLWAVVLLVAAVALHQGQPVNKKVWSPSFVGLTCGLSALLLAGLAEVMDRRKWLKPLVFFDAFGTNSIYCYIMADVAAWAYYLLHVQQWSMGALGYSPFHSLLWALWCVLTVWLCVLPLYHRKIFVKL